MQYKFVMFQTQAVSPITFRFHISMQAKIIRTSSCSEKSGKTGKNAPSVTGGGGGVKEDLHPWVKVDQAEGLYHRNHLTFW